MATTTENYTGNGSTKVYSFTFPYLKTEDVKVQVNGVDRNPGTDSTEYSVSATSLTFVTAPTNGHKIKIYRKTDCDNAKAVFAAGASIRARDLNNNTEQTLYFAQEFADPNNPISATSLGLDEAAKVDGSVIYYNSLASKFKADANQTLTTLVDGGSYA
jgi:hypothetical protein